MTNLVLTAVGDDRPGLVSALAESVAARGGNWLTSEMARLGGKFAGVVLVEVVDDQVDAFTSAVQALGVLEVTVSRAGDEEAYAGSRWSLDVLGNDRPGIVREITSALARAGVSIERLETGTRDAPMTGGVLFEARAVLTAPEGTDRAEVAGVLEDIAQELMVDVELSEDAVEDSALRAGPVSELPGQDPAAHAHDATAAHARDNTPGDWDARYAEAADGGRVWSGNPNGLLVREVESLEPSTALDVGCGEGADAVWLAGRGWAVTAVDVSTVAVDRGRVAAADAGVRVDWHVQDVAELRGAYDLVSAFYPVLRKDSGVLEHVLGLVAPGGTLLFVHHLDTDRERALSHGFDPDDYVGPDDVAAALHGRPGWRIARQGSGDRDITSGAGADHHRDGIVRAVREG